MMWLALPLTVWALVAAYAIWTWRDICLATMAEKREEQNRINADATQKLIKQWSAIMAESRKAPSPQPAPIAGDNVTELRPPFGKKRPDPDGSAA